MSGRIYTSALDAKHPDTLGYGRGKSLRPSLRRPYRSVFHDFAYELSRQLADCETVLDLGCGSSSPIRHLSGTFHSVGVDIFEPSLEKSRAAGVHDEYLAMDVLDIGKSFAQKSFHCVLALNLIEHFEKKDGIRLLEMMEGVSSKKVIVLTPNGFLPQEEYDANVRQVHRSGWSAREMKQMGYNVIGIKGWKPLRGERASLRFSPKPFWLAVSDVTQLFVRNRPELAFHILCVKSIR